MEDMQMTEFYCHYCGGWIRKALDYSLNGNHVIECPKCKHEHCRVIVNGEITGDRWQSRNQTITYTTNMSSYYLSSSSTTSMTAGLLYLAQSWLNTTVA